MPQGIYYLEYVPECQMYYTKYEYHWTWYVKQNEIDNPKMLKKYCKFKDVFWIMKISNWDFYYFVQNEYFNWDIELYWHEY